MAVTLEEVTARRVQQHAAATDRVVFKVTGLYGLARKSVKLPVSRTESIDSGPITVTIDPDSDPSGNVGLLDFASRTLRVRYGVQVVFAGLHDLVTSGKHDLSLLNPPRAIATDDCTVTPDLSGWRALGCLDFLPGSLWAGASGG